MKRRYIWDDRLRDFVPWEEYRRPLSNSGPSIISDTTDAFRSMADGKMYDSKRAYRKELKRRGFVEVGNERLDPPKPRPVDREGIRAAIRAAREQASARR